MKLNINFKLINHCPPLLKSNILVCRQACFRYEMSVFNDCYKSVFSFSKQTFFLPLHCVSNIFVNFAFLFFIENYQVDVVNIKVNTGKMLYETPKRHQNNKMSSQTFIIKIVTILPYCLLWWNYQHCDQFDNMFSINS